MDRRGVVRGPSVDADPRLARIPSSDAMSTLRAAAMPAQASRERGETTPVLLLAVAPRALMLRMEDR